MNPFEQAFWIRIGTAALCGGLIGLERQLRGKPAGIRTSMLVCLGTCVFVRLGVELGGEHADTSRVLGQVVTGIGFLGGGVILTQGSVVRGVTSAAVIWSLAGIGAAVGLGYPYASAALTAVTLFILVGVELLERAFQRLRWGAHADDPQSHQPPPPGE